MQRVDALAKIYKRREVEKALRKYDERFRVYEGRGKGGHVMIMHPDINGRKEAYPLPSRRGDDIDPNILRDLKKRFCIPDDVLPLH